MDALRIDILPNGTAWLEIAELSATTGVQLHTRKDYQEVILNLNMEQLTRVRDYLNQYIDGQ